MSGLWRPCEYKEWRGDLPWDGGRMVCACVWPLDGVPAAIKWLELADGDNPREANPAHHAVRMLAFWEWEDEGG